MLRSPQHAQKHDVSKPIMENQSENVDVLKPWSERSDTTRVILRRMSSNRKRPTILPPDLGCPSTSSSDDCGPRSAPPTMTQIRPTRHSLVIRNDNTISRFVFETDFRCSGKCGVSFYTRVL
ncbi:hypothetical protein Y032_0003g1322 [Ancylostoma ceylanicum]|uniref:Uncharacterized protein n=1 Tax=Ancylostoma ceylanicum TaxID=53326 RepID=A0A016VWH3_9BILA|nr:hypothetical protein Y032_0003g1322 [Ancylostoma ceylanicum]